MKGSKGDPVLNAAREKAIREAYLPESIKKKFKIVIEDGKVTLTRRKKKKKKIISRFKLIDLE